MGVDESDHHGLINPSNVMIATSCIKSIDILVPIDNQLKLIVLLRIRAAKAVQPGRCRKACIAGSCSKTPKTSRATRRRKFCGSSPLAKAMGRQLQVWLYEHYMLESS